MVGPIGCPESSVGNYHYALRNSQKSGVLNKLLFLSVHVEVTRISIVFFFYLYRSCAPTLMRLDIVMTVGVNYSVSVFWFVLPFRPMGGSKGSSTHTYADKFFVHGQCLLFAA